MIYHGIRPPPNKDGKYRYSAILFRLRKVGLERAYPDMVVMVRAMAVPTVVTNMVTL